MTNRGTANRDLGVLQSKRNSMRFQILIEIADRQPAVSQQEIADTVGVTAQAVSDYLIELVADGFVVKHGRGRYEVTKEGVDWLISETDALEEYLEYVAESVIGQVDIEAAVAVSRIAEGDRVSLVMQDGMLHAAPEDGGATGIAVTSASRGEAVGVTEFQGIVDYEPGRVTILPLPSVENSSQLPTNVKELINQGELIVAAGIEAVVCLRQAGIEPDIRFGTTLATSEAATRGLDVVLVVADSLLSRHTSVLRDGGIRFEVLDEPDTLAPKKTGMHPSDDS